MTEGAAPATRPAIPQSSSARPAHRSSPRSTAAHTQGRGAEVSPPRPARRRHARSWALPARYVGGFFLWTSGVHVGIVAAGPEFYRHFADGTLLPGLSVVWDSVFMTHAVASGLVVAAGEAFLAALLLGPRRWHRLGWAGTIAFHLTLMWFGWGFWLWCVPALALLVHGARGDRVSAEGPGSSQAVTLVDHFP